MHWLLPLLRPTADQARAIVEQMLHEMGATHSSRTVSLVGGFHRDDD